MGYYNQSEEELWKMVTSLFPDVRRANSMWVVGAHRFDEYGILSWIFPQIDDLVLFEPIPSLAEGLRQKFTRLPWVKVIEKALYSMDGQASLILTNNDGASSSILKMGEHKRLFPSITEKGTIKIETRTFATVLAEEKLSCPKILILDTQGAEGSIIAAAPIELLNQILLIYTETSLVDVYEKQWKLDDLADLLRYSHRLVAYTPITPEVPEHGNAVFVNKQVY